MGCNRASNPINEYKINKEKGATLIFAIAVAIIVLIVLGGIYYMLTRAFQTSEDIKTYTSVKEAAESAVRYGVVLINQNKPYNDGAGMPDRCTKYTMNYKLFGSSTTYIAIIQICFLGYQAPPGTEAQGAAYSKTTAGGKGEIYSIVSEAEGPNNTKVRIEASYVR
jgi:Tfp pilus assembly protein PilX